MALTKAKDSRLRKEDVVGGKVTPAKAPVKTIKAKQKPAAKKAGAKKSAKKKGDNESIAKGASGKQGKILVPVTTEQHGAGKRQKADPFEVAKRKMKGSMPAIMDAMVELAKQGSCSHAKTLLEMTGAKHMFDEEAETQDSGEPWAKMVLERLGEAESAEQETVSV